MKKPTNFTLSLVDPIAASLVLKHERNFPANARDEILARTEDNHDFDFIADPRDLVSRIFRRNGRVGTYYGSSWDEILAYNAKQVAAGTPSNCVAFEDSAGTIPLLAPLGSGKGCGLLKDRSGGNHHRIQTSATARGEMSRRVNMLDKTDQITDAAWLFVGGIKTGGQLDPKGGMTACFMQGPSSQPPVRIINSWTASSAVCSIRAKWVSGPVEVRRFLLRNGTTGINFSPLTINLRTGVVVSGDGWQVTPDSNGFFRLSYVRTSGISIGNQLIVYYGEMMGATDDSVWAIAFPDLRPDSDAIPSIPPYQRVTSASDYDEENFPAFLRRQTDDWSKAHINPNGATKVFALTAIQKMSDAAIGAVLELGTNPASGSGNFSVLAPATAGPTYRMGSKGSTALVSTISDSTFPAPVRSLVVGIGDIANDVCSLTVNGTTTTSAVDQGTGTYTEQDVLFGARAGTSMFVNDREYSPPLILFMQPSDPGISDAAIRNLTKLFSKGIRL